MGALVVSVESSELSLSRSSSRATDFTNTGLSLITVAGFPGITGTGGSLIIFLPVINRGPYQHVLVG